MLGLIEKLREDHQLIYEKLARLRALWRSLEKDPAGLRTEIRKELDSLETFLHLHHDTEEATLFPRIQALATPVNNGPRCNLYMTEHVISPALRAAEERARSSQFAFQSNGTRRAKILELQRSGSFLAIPMEEHEAGAVHIQLLYEQLANPDTHWSDLAISLHAYLDLIESHARKEDDCLFPQVTTLVLAE